MKKIAVIITFLAFFAACEKDIYLDDLAETEKQLALNCVANNLSTFKAGIYTTGALGKIDSSCLYVDALVELYQDGNLIGQMQYDTAKQIQSVSPFYSLDFIPVPGHEYEIKAQSGDLTASGKFYMNYPVKIQNVSAVLDTATRNLDLKIKFNDPDTINNYLVIAYIRASVVYIDNRNGNWDSTYIYKQEFLPLYTDEIDAGLFGANDLEIYALFDHEITSDYILKDTKFNGENVNLTYSSYIIHDIKDWDTTVVVALFNIPPDTYRYFETLSKFRMSQYNPFVEPVNVYTNVSGGVGAVVGMSADTMRVKVQVQ